MNTDPVLSKAARLAKSRDYTGAIRTLDLEENRYSGSHKYYYLYAVVCLYSGDFGGALAHFRTAFQIKPKDPSTMLGLAALYLNRKDTGQAVDYYLDVEEIDHKNKTAKRGLAVIRKYSTADEIASWLAAGKLKNLYPPIPPAGFNPRILRIVLPVAAALSLCAFALLVKFGALPSPFKSRSAPRRPAAEISLSQEDRSQPVEVGGSYRYILTRNQALDLYDEALSLFTSYRDEAAKIRVNRILESNASEGLLNKARLLLTYTETPGFDNFRQSDNIPYADVIEEPVLYRDVHVIWRGMATNIEVLQEYTAFDFLVGYDTRTTLQGIVPAVFNGALNVNSERPLEVLGRIVLQDSSFAAIRLDVVAVYQSGRLELE